jgi:hypothetical protein
MEIANCGDLNNDGLPEFVVQVYDSIVVYKNTSTSTSLSFSRTYAAKFPKKPSLATGSGNFVFNMEIADIDRDGYPDVMTHFTVTNKSIDSNFVFFCHQKATKTSISFNKIQPMYLKWKVPSSGGGTVDIGNCYLYSPACQKPNLIALFDAAESGSTNTFYFYENLSKPGTIQFNPKACIVNNAHSDAMAYADFNNDGIRDYVTYQDASAITTFTDTSHVHPVAKPTNKADVTLHDTCIGSHKYTFVTLNLLYLECATDTVGYVWSKGVSSTYAALLDSGTFSVKYTNTTGSVDSTIYFHVTNVRKKPTISPVDTFICPNQYVSLKVRGSKYYTWRCDNSSVSLGHIHDSGQFVSSPSSDAHFKVYCTGAGGCHDTLYSTMTIGAPPQIVVTPKDTTVCFGKSVDVALRGASKYTILNKIYLAKTNDSNYVSTPFLPVAYKVVAERSHCVDTAVININVHHKRFSIISTKHNPDTLFCVNEKPFFYVHNNKYSAGYGTNIHQQDDSTFYCTPATAGVYTFISTSDSICYDTSNVTITLENPPVITGLKDTFVCGGSSITLKAGGATNWSWSPIDYLNNDTSSKVISTPEKDITYTVIGSDVRCKDTTHVTIHYVVMPTVEAGPNDTVDYLSTYTLSGASNTGTYFVWKSNPYLTDTTTMGATTEIMKKTTNFILTGWNEKPCYVNDTVEIFVRTKPYVFFPLAFTPNNDGKNDFFHPLMHTVSRIDWAIYDRWGNKLYEGDLHSKWDGT